MKKKVSLLMVVFLLIPLVKLKAQHHSGDSTFCYNLMTNNFTTGNQLNWSDPNPDNWLGVTWNTANPKRIIRLSLDQDGDLGGWGFHNGTGTTMAAAETGFVDIGGVDAGLAGFIDFSSLTELEGLNLKNQGSVTGINLAGLANFQHFIMKGNGHITALNFDNFPALRYIHLNSMNNLDSLTAANCPNLLSVFERSGSVSYVDFSGSNAIRSIVLMSSNLTTIDVTGKTNLEGLKIQNSQLDSIVGINTCSSLIHLRADGNSNLVGDFDIANYNSAGIYRIDLDDTKITSLINWTMLGSPNRIRVENARLTLSNATQIANEVTAGSLGYNNQTRWGGDTIYVGGMTDFPGEDTIDINGTNVASTFTLFHVTGAQVGGTNQTGNFTFPNLTDTGAYYVGMTNPGAAPANNAVNLLTDTFWVIQCPMLNTSTSVINSTIAAVNQPGVTYQWLDCDNGNALIPGAIGLSYTPTESGNYAVEITYGGACVDTSACVNIITIGMDEMSENSTVSVYPNPMNEQVTISLEKAVKNTQVMIVNVEGKVVYNNIVNTNRLVVDGSDWNNGIYIVRITNEEYAKTLKLIK